MLHQALITIWKFMQSLDDEGNELRWEAVIVELIEAYRRVREKEQ